MRVSHIDECEVRRLGASVALCAWVARRTAFSWFALALAALALSGVLALVLVIARLPGSALIHDVDLARRSLVVHVDLATDVWFFAYLAGLLYLLAPGPRAARWLPAIAALGVTAFVFSVAVRGAHPVLSNYVPVLDDGLFLSGLTIFAVALTAAILVGSWRARVDAGGLVPPEAATGVRVAALTFLVAIATFSTAYATRDPATRDFERLFWGGGHILQTSAAIAMLATWLILLRRVTGRPAMRPRTAAILFVAMLVPTLAGPALSLDRSPSPLFTSMMQFGIAPEVVVVIAAGVVSLWRAERRCTWTPALTGLVVAVVMTLIGFALGARISANTTLVPAHYHLDIGAVTVSFMALTLTLLPDLGARHERPHLAALQPVIYGAGQTLFATGLAIAGAWGHAGRKLYGPEQHLSSSGRLGFLLAGVGGGVALIGGGLFFVLIGKAWLRRR